MGWEKVYLKAIWRPEKTTKIYQPSTWYLSIYYFTYLESINVRIKYIQIIHFQL
jgi:hypothetical protein